MKCSFCSLVFDESGARHHCQGCFMAAGCRSVRCPRCGYEMPEEIGLTRRFAEWREKLRRRRNAAARAGGTDRDTAVNSTIRVNGKENVGVANGAMAIPLAAMQPGESGLVVDIRSGSNGQMQKCLALGILPGASIVLRKRSPSFIFDIGFSQFAVDEGMARAVLVRLHQE